MTTPDEDGLGWGETPLDKLSHLELLRVSQRLYAALKATQGALEIAKSVIAINPKPLSIERDYWGGGGGAIALEKARQALTAVDGESEEPAYHSFYRYANALLFEHGEHWAICPACKTMKGTFWGQLVSFDGEPCQEAGCNGVQRTITWDDLQPQNSKSEAL